MTALVPIYVTAALLWALVAAVHVTSLLVAAVQR